MTSDKWNGVALMQAIVLTIAYNLGDWSLIGFVVISSWLVFATLVISQNDNQDDDDQDDTPSRPARIGFRCGGTKDELSTHSV